MLQPRIPNRDPLSVKRSRIGQLNSWLLALLAFSLPLSTSAISALAVLVSVLWLIEGRYLDKWREIVHNPVAVAVLLYLAMYVLGLLWSEDKISGMAMIEKQWKLMLMPVFLTVGSLNKRRLYAGAFLAGMTIAMLMTYLAWFGVLHYGDVSPEHLTKKTFHVIYNPMLALAIYLLLHEVLWGRVKGWARPALIGLAACMVFDMFITEGRTGQLVFFVLSGLLLFQIFRGHTGRAVLAAGVLLPALLAAGYALSPTFHDRVEKARSEITRFHSNPETSVGLRLLYWQNSWAIIKNNPLLGVGTGDFQSAYAEVNQARSPRVGVTDNPHNQYVLILSQFGLIGLAVLLAVFLTQIRRALSQRDNWQRIRLAFPVFFLTIMLTESYLIVYETGFLFSLFTAFLYKQEQVGEEVEGC